MNILETPMVYIKLSHMLCYVFNNAFKQKPFGADIHGASQWRPNCGVIDRKRLFQAKHSHLVAR